MEFVNSSLPRCISLGAQADVLWATNIVALTSGVESSNQNWQDCRHNYDISYAVRTVTDFVTIRTHFHTMRGRAKMFPFLDPIDSVTLQAEGVLTSTGVSNEYQAYKRYGAGSEAYDRKITRPIAPILVYRTRSAVTTVITPTIDYSTGKVTVSGHVGGDTYAWSGSFNVPCRYDTDRLPALVRDKEPGDTGELLVSCDSIVLVEVKE